MHLEKQLLRKQIKKLVLGLSNEERRERSINLANMLINNSHIKSAKNVLLFSSLKDEVDTSFLINMLVSTKQLYLPIIDGDNLLIAKYDSDSLIEGSFNILEPKNTDLIDINDIDVVIVPAVAYDNACGRLGRGKGFYDRLLFNADCYKIGVCFKEQVVDKIPIEKHDVKVDELIVC